MSGPGELKEEVRRLLLAVAVLPMASAVNAHAPNVLTARQLPHEKADGSRDQSQSFTLDANTGCLVLLYQAPWEA